MVKYCLLGKNVEIPYPNLVNLYECEIGENTLIGPFVEIQQGVKIGSNCKIESHTFICSGTTIGNCVFVGHGVMFINDKYPKVKNPLWKIEETLIEDNVSIGSNSTILPVKIGSHSKIGAGSVVTKNVQQKTIVAGNPAKMLRRLYGRTNSF